MQPLLRELYRNVRLDRRLAGPLALVFAPLALQPPCERLGRDKSLTAQALGVDRKTLYRKLERWRALGGKG